MPFPSFGRVRDLGVDDWRVATWLAPLLIQIVLAVMFLVMWLLGQWPFAAHSEYEGEGVWFSSAVVITSLTSFGASALLLLSRSSRRRAVALSLACSTAIVLIGGVIYASLLLR